MTEFLFALGVFLLAHLIPPIPPIRGFLIGLVGRRLYLLGYSALSIALIVWVIVAAQRAPYVPLWAWHPWQSVVPLVVMPLAAWLIVAGLAEQNPLSISLRSADAARPGSAAAVTRHPVLWGFLLWATSHIPPNGDLVSLILFGFVSGLAALGFYTLDLRARRRLGNETWQELARTTSMIPFLALLEKRATVRLTSSAVLSAIAATAFYLWFILQGHQSLIGVDPLAGLAP